MARILLHDEIAAILTDNGNRWISEFEMAALVNARGHYKKTATAKTPDVRGFQVRLRARNYPNMFEADGNRIRLRGKRDQ